MAQCRLHAEIQQISVCAESTFASLQLVAQSEMGMCCSRFETRSNPLCINIKIKIENSLNEKK